jgi:SAM-dependent methyltransferase
MIDWSQEWKKHREGSSWNRWLKEKDISNEQYWDRYEFGDRYEEYNRIAGYPGAILERMLCLLDFGSTVLDIGAGAGAYAIPLARVARRVIVVEPSRGQIARLMRQAKQEGLENIEVINKRWQDVDRSELETYSIVNAAYCFQMINIKEDLQKMLDVTGKTLFLVSLADHDFYDVYQRVFGEQKSDPDCIYLYNCLYQMGHPANIEIFTRRYLLPLQMQLDILKETYDLTPEATEGLRDHLASTGRLVEEDGKEFVKRKHKDGMIWYPMD